MTKPDVFENEQRKFLKERRKPLEKQLEDRLAGLRARGISVVETDNIDMMSVFTERLEQDPSKMRIWAPANLPWELPKLHNRQVYTEEFAEGVKKDFYAFYGNKVTSPGMICDAALVFLMAFKAVYGGSIKIGANQYEWLRDDDMNRLAILVTAMYLENWLSEDEENYQTPYGFAKYPYQKEKRHQKKYNKIIAAGEISRIERACEQYFRFFEIRQDQAKKENTQIDPAPQYEKRGHGKKVDLTVLAWCEAWVDGKLDLLDYLFYKKTVMGYETDRRRKRSADLADVCNDYQKYIQTINDIDIGEEAPLCDTRKFVATSMMLHKLERAYRFHMYAEIANSICQKKIDLDKFNLFTWISFFGRYEAADDRLFKPAWARQEKTQKYTGLSGEILEKYSETYVLADEPIDVLNTEFYIKHVFALDGEEQSHVEAELNIPRRKLLLDLYIFLDCLYPLGQQMSWDDKMFRDAALFYRYSYPVTDELLQTDFPQYTGETLKKVNEFYKQFKSVYQSLGEINDFPLAEGRKVLQEKRKADREKRKKIGKK